MGSSLDEHPDGQGAVSASDDVTAAHYAERPQQDSAAFDALLARLDELIARHDGVHPAGRGNASASLSDAARLGLLVEVVEKATEGLERFPRNGELLRRRAYALCRLAPPGTGDARVADAQEDLQCALQFEPTNLRLALDLLGELFAFDGLQDDEVADVAEALAEQSEQLMLEARALQVRALLYAERAGEARSLAARWSRLFPGNDELGSVIRDFDL